jgi:hypothetical protein
MPGLSDGLKGLAVPFRALAVALLGVLWAWLWFNSNGLLAAATAVLALLVGAGLDAIGRHAPFDKPARAVTFMEWWIVVPMVLAGAASAITVIVAVALVVPDSAGDQVKETVGALATAITAFLSSGFVDWAADDSDSRVSDRIQEHFHDVYKDKFKPGSAAQLYVFSGSYGGATGWGRKARRSRAEGIQTRYQHDKI